MTICYCFSLQGTVYDKDPACVHTISSWRKNEIKILPVTTTVLKSESMKSMLLKVKSSCPSVPNSILIHVSVAKFFTFFSSNRVCIHLTGMMCDSCNFQSKNCYLSVLKTEVWLADWYCPKLLFLPAGMQWYLGKASGGFFQNIQQYFSSEACLCTSKQKINGINLISL